MAESKASIDTATLLQIIDHLTSAVILVDHDRNVMLSNRKAELLSHKSKTQMQGLRGGEVLGCVYAHASPEGCGFGPQCELCTIRRKVAEAFDDQKGIPFFDTCMEMDDIGRRDLQVSVQFLRLDTLDAALISIEDVTEIRANARLEKQNAQLAAVVETAGAVCHELNQPMMAVSGYIQLLLADRSLEDLRTRYLTEMNQEIERMIGITRKLMAIDKYRTKAYAGVSRILDIERSTQQTS